MPNVGRELPGAEKMELEPEPKPAPLELAAPVTPPNPKGVTAAVAALAALPAEGPNMNVEPPDPGAPATPEFAAGASVLGTAPNTGGAAAAFVAVAFVTPASVLPNTNGATGVAELLAAVPASCCCCWDSWPGPNKKVVVGLSSLAEGAKPNGAICADEQAGAAPVAGSGLAADTEAAGPNMKGGAAPMEVEGPALAAGASGLTGTPNAMGLVPNEKELPLAGAAADEAGAGAAAPKRPGVAAADGFMVAKPNGFLAVDSSASVFCAVSLEKLNPVANGGTVFPSGPVPSAERFTPPNAPKVAVAAGCSAAPLVLNWKPPNVAGAASLSGANANPAPALLASAPPASAFCPNDGVATPN